MNEVVPRFEKFKVLELLSPDGMYRIDFKPRIHPRIETLSNVHNVYHEK